MIPSSLTVLHGGHGPEIALLEYLTRVLLYLVAFGGIAVLVFWWLAAVEAVRSGFSARRASEESE